MTYSQWFLHHPTKIAKHILYLSHINPCCLFCFCYCRFSFVVIPLGLGVKGGVVMTPVIFGFVVSSPVCTLCSTGGLFTQLGTPGAPWWKSLTAAHAASLTLFPLLVAAGVCSSLLTTAVISSNSYTHPSCIYAELSALTSMFQTLSCQSPPLICLNKYIL